MSGEYDLASAVTYSYRKSTTYHGYFQITICINGAPVFSNTALANDHTNSTGDAPNITVHASGRIRLAAGDIVRVGTLQVTNGGNDEYLDQNISFNYTTIGFVRP
jgi:hypothetical protein